MRTYKERVKRAREAYKNFDARTSRCPICKADFRRGCSHSIEQAQTVLFERYVRTVAGK